MKTFIFARGLTFYEIRAESPMLAIRQLVARYGRQPYRIVNIIPAP